MTDHFDVVVVGSGPAGQKAAICAAKAGRSVVVIEREEQVGGACVHHGTVPSKTLRETALLLSSFRRKAGSIALPEFREDVKVASLMSRLDEVVAAHERTIADQLRRNDVVVRHGLARFVGLRELEVRQVRGGSTRLRGDTVILAVGSRPRAPTDLSVDHENVLDSDSILSMTYLPESLTVLGAGVIASEYASIFASLGVRVTMIDRGARPVAFLDEELTSRFVAAFERGTSRFLPNREVIRVEWDGGAVIARLRDGEAVASEKLLFALGRIANLDGLAIGVTGLAATPRGLLAVDENCRTSVPGIYAVGDVIGPPSLASSSMEQGRRAVRHALGLPSSAREGTMPLAVYTVPEMASVGLSEAAARERFGECTVGRAPFAELARGQIAAIDDGLLKLVADRDGKKLLGVQIVGEGAAELVHVGQMALAHDADVDLFIEQTFNFPTLAEAYLVAALDIVKRRRA